MNIFFFWSKNLGFKIVNSELDYCIQTLASEKKFLQELLLNRNKISTEKLIFLRKISIIMISAEVDHLTKTHRALFTRLVIFQAQIVINRRYSGK